MKVWKLVATKAALLAKQMVEMMEGWRVLMKAALLVVMWVLMMV